MTAQAGELAGGMNARISLVMSLRKRGVSDISVLSAMEKTPRELFAHQAFGEQAYYDMALPINCGQTISQPFVVAYMAEMLAVGKSDMVLEIGTGSGYQAAVLSHLARRVFTIEIHRELQQLAQDKFIQLDLDNIHTHCADGHAGWPEQAPFERIIVTAAAPEPPQTLLQQLALGGRLVMPIGDSPDSQFITTIDHTDKGFEQEQLLPVRFAPLLRASDKNRKA